MLPLVIGAIHSVLHLLASTLDGGPVRAVPTTE
jgi:hypothetical protein